MHIPYPCLSVKQVCAVEFSSPRPSSKHNCSVLIDLGEGVVTHWWWFLPSGGLDRPNTCENRDKAEIWVSLSHGTMENALMGSVVVHSKYWTGYSNNGHRFFLCMYGSEFLLYLLCHKCSDRTIDVSCCTMFAPLVHNTVFSNAQHMRIHISLYAVD